MTECTVTVDRNGFDPSNCMGRKYKQIYREKVTSSSPGSVRRKKEKNISFFFASKHLQAFWPFSLLL